MFYGIDRFSRAISLRISGRFLVNFIIRSLGEEWCLGSGSRGIFPQIIYAKRFGFSGLLTGRLSLLEGLFFFQTMFAEVISSITVKVELGEVTGDVRGCSTHLNDDFICFGVTSLQWNLKS